MPEKPGDLWGLQEEAEEALSQGKGAKMKLAIDASQHNLIYPAQWDNLATVEDGVMLRLTYGITGDIAVEDHLVQINRVHLPWNAYHWGDPTWDFARQLEVAVAAINKYKPAAWFLDVEQYWNLAGWAIWAKGDYVALQNYRISPDKLNTFYHDFRNAVAARVNIPVGCYSGEWFIREYCPQLATWIYQQNYWGASYVSFENWWAGYLAKNPSIDVNKLHALANIIPVYRGDIRQWTSKIPGAEGFPESLDHSVVLDTKFPGLFGAPGKPDDGTVIPPPIVTSYRVMTDCNVRSVPNGTIVGYRYTGNKVTSISESMGWVEAEAVNQQYGSKGWIAKIALAPVGNVFKVKAVSLWIRSAPYVSPDNRIGYLWYGAIVQVDKTGLGGWVHIVANNGKPAGWVQSINNLVPA